MKRRGLSNLFSGLVLALAGLIAEDRLQRTLPRLPLYTLPRAQECLGLVRRIGLEELKTEEEK